MNDWSHITTLVFDFGGVLIDLDRQACIEAFRRLGLPIETLIPNNYHSVGPARRLETGDITAADFRRLIRTQSGRDFTDSAFDEAINAFLLAIPVEKLRLLRALRRRFRVLMLSNTNEIHMNYAYAHQFRAEGLDVTAYFDRLYLSYEMHLSKPDPRIFRSLLESEKLDADACFYLDDSTANLATASQLGFHTYLVGEHQDLRPLFADVLDTDVT